MKRTGIPRIHIKGHEIGCLTCGKRSERRKLRKVTRFMADRLIHIYGENPNTDYILLAYKQTED